MPVKKRTRDILPLNIADGEFAGVARLFAWLDTDEVDALPDLEECVDVVQGDVADCHVAEVAGAAAAAVGWMAMRCAAGDWVGGGIPPPPQSPTYTRLPIDGIARSRRDGRQYSRYLDLLMRVRARVTI